MGKYLLLVVAWLAISSAVAAVSVLQYFQAITEGTDIRLDWEVDNESGLARFELHRKLDGEAAYIRVATVQASNQLHYTFVDGDLFRNTTQTQRSVFYKLVLISGSGETTYYTSVLHNPSAVQRSWGSIKSMFR